MRRTQVQGQKQSERKSFFFKKKQASFSLSLCSYAHTYRDTLSLPVLQIGSYLPHKIVCTLINHNSIIQLQATTLHSIIHHSIRSLSSNPIPTYSSDKLPVQYIRVVATHTPPPSDIISERLKKNFVDLQHMYYFAWHSFTHPFKPIQAQKKKDALTRRHLITMHESDSWS